MFSTSGSQGIVVFLHQTAWRYSARNSLNEGVKYDTIVCIQRAVKDWRVASLVHQMQMG